MKRSDQPLKVMHIVARLNIGGVASYVISLNAHLNTLDCRSQLVCGIVSKAEGDMRYLADELGVAVTVIPSLGREISPLRDLATLWALWRLIRREGPGVVHTHTAKAGFVGRMAAWLAHVPVIVHTFHGHVFAGYFSPAKTRLYLRLERFCARLSTRIITLSAGLKRELTDIYHITQPERIEIVELGFDLKGLSTLARHQGTFRAQNNIPEQVPVIGIVGRIVPVKNHDLFLQAAQLVHQRLPHVYFAIVGDGERRTELAQQACALGIDQRVRFAGWITDMPSIYSALDVVVLSSVNEGLPVSLIEAMAAGVPVVATAVGGVNDLLENGRLGAMVPSGDASAMADAIIKALTDPVTRQVTESARTAALGRYDIRHSAEKTNLLYRQLIEAKRK